MNRYRQNPLSAIVSCALLALLCIFIASAARADSGLRLEIAGGQARFGKSPAGMWWQPDQENASQYKDNGSFEIGLSGKLNPAYGWSMRYVNLGRVHVNSRAVTCPNDDCSRRDKSINAQRPECYPSFNESNCRYQWLGDGGIRGINFAIDTELLRIGRLGLEGELGLFLYQMKYNAQVYPLDCKDGACPWRIAIDQKSHYYLSPMGGLTTRLHLTELSSIYVSTRIYARTSQHTPMEAGFSGPAQSWMIGIRTAF